MLKEGLSIETLLNHLSFRRTIPLSLDFKTLFLIWNSWPSY
jgi:hypothetical protein